jgi:flavodoxin
MSDGAGGSPTSTPAEPSASPFAEPTRSGARARALLAYFSRAGENYYYGDRIDLEVGNTEVVAGIIADLAEVDVYEITPADPYPEDYEATVRRNVQEQAADARPEIAGSLPDLAGYDTVMLGSGVWNVQAPMIMRTFIESVDLDGRTVLPLVTYAVSGMGRVTDDYRRMLPESTIGEGLAIRGEEAADARPEVRAWLRRADLLD